MAEVSSGFRIYADSSQFQSEMAKVARTAERAGQGITKAFDAKNLGRTLATALGLNLNTIAEKLIDGYKEAAEHAEKLEAFTARAADATTRLLKLRQDDNTQLEQMEKAAKRIGQALENALNEKPKQSWFAGLIQKGSALDKIFGLSRTEENKKQEKIAENTAKLAEQEADNEAQRLKIEEKKWEQEIRNWKARQKFVQDNREQLELEAKLVSGRILPAEQARLDILRKQEEIKKNSQKIEEILQKYPEERTKQEKDALQLLFQQRTILEKQLEIKKGLLETGKDQVPVEAEITKKAAEFVALKRVGRGDKELSDRELQQKRDELERDIEARTVRSRNAVSEGAAYDPLLYVQTKELENLKQQMQVRMDVRRNAAFFGEDAAFKMSGLSERDFQSILNMTTEAQKQTEFLRQLVDHQRNPKAVTPVYITGGG